jgi:hypothetical protein
VREYLLNKEVAKFTSEELIEYIEAFYKEDPDHESTRIVANLAIGTWIMKSKHITKSEMENTLEHLKMKGLIKR